MEEIQAYAMIILVNMSLVLGAVFIALGFDDVLIDLYAVFKKLKPIKLEFSDLLHLNEKKEKRIAIIVPAWKESGIIGRMILGNIARLEYKNYCFFIGVYPNDVETVKEVKGLSEKCPQVICVVNVKPGPTTKGQMLNCVIKEVMAGGHGARFAAVHMQDSEDLMHPKILKLVNHKLDSYDFIQTPVFSLSNRWNHLVGGSYMDEFAESHTKDLLVRESLGAAVPSAGVGTTISRSIMVKFKANGIELFNDGSLTEDYELGMICHAWKFKSHFACHYFYDAQKKVKDFIATQEYFPNAFRSSVRQKTRWTIGIALQGWQNLSWHGSFFNRYFLYRDRKGLFSNSFVVLGYINFALLSGAWIAFTLQHQDAAVFYKGSWQILLAEFLLISNLGLMLNRFVQRLRCTKRVYGSLSAVFVALRWPVGCVINGFAALSAMGKFSYAKVTGKALSWSKTTHRLPEQFGSVIEIQSAQSK